MSALSYPRSYPSPWPQVEEARNRHLIPRGRVYGFWQCQDCTRWFPHEKPLDAPEPRFCPLHDANAEAARERAKRLRLKRGAKFALALLEQLFPEDDAG